MTCLLECKKKGGRELSEDKSKHEVRIASCAPGWQNQETHVLQTANPSSPGSDPRDSGDISTTSYLDFLVAQPMYPSIMTYFTENDPLLPRGKRSPEIHGSRPQSIHEDIMTAESQPTAGDESPHAPLHRGLKVLIPALVVLFLFSFVADEWPAMDHRPIPRTVEERVTRILTDTPLIGMRIQSSSVTSSD